MTFDDWLRARMSRPKQKVLDREGKISFENDRRRLYQREIKNKRPQTPHEWKEYNDRMARKADGI